MNTTQTKQTQLNVLLLCLQRLEKNHNPTIDNGIQNNQKNVELYKAVLGMQYTIPNLRRIGACIINSYNIKESHFYMYSSCIQHTVKGIRLAKQPQWQTYIFNPIMPREFEKGIYTLEAKIPTQRINSFIIGLSNKKIPRHQTIYYYYLSHHTHYMWLHLKDNHNSTEDTIEFDNRSLKINNKLDTNDTYTFNIFNRDTIHPPEKIKNQYNIYGENWSSTSSGKPIVIRNNPHTIVKIIYHSYDHTIQYYINETLLCTIPAEIDAENMYPFIAGTSYEQTSTIEFI